MVSNVKIGISWQSGSWPTMCNLDLIDGSSKSLEFTIYYDKYTLYLLQILKIERRYQVLPGFVK
jgi:hypothetical protein